MNERGVTTEKLCATCRWWGDEDAESGYRLCEQPRIRRGYLTRRDGPFEPSGALVENDEGWSLATGPEFGCRLHEERSAREGDRAKEDIMDVDLFKDER